MMQYLRDYAIRKAQEQLGEGGWRMALTCLTMYDEKATAAERGNQIPHGY